MNKFLVVLIGSGVAALAAASEAPPNSAAVFDTDLIRLAIATNGVPQTLLEKSTHHDWLAPKAPAFAAIKKAGKLFPATALRPAGDVWRADFGAAVVQVDFRIIPRMNYVVFELARLAGEGVQELRLAQVQVTCRENSGSWLGVCWNDQFSVALLGLSDRVDVRLGGNGMVMASVYPEFGMEGQRVVLVAAPTSRFLNVVQEVERDFGLPSPRLGGQWAKTSRNVHTSYFFTDLTESNADETIRYAKLGGFGYVMTYDGTWAKSLGSYPVNSNNFPQGEASLKATVDKCHAAGLKVGLHILTSFVGKNDPLVRPKPDARLLKDDHATLAADVDAKTKEIDATGPLATFPLEGAFYGDAKAGFDIQIDDELIQYRTIGGPATNRFLRCVRGYAGTKAAPHRAGAPIHHLVERYGCYLADLRTTLKDEIADRIAGVINRCGFDMIYFDGGECNMANGPYWYWVSQEQDAICRRVNRELLVQGSGGTHWTWHWFARGCCDDFAAVAPKQYLDYHKIADSWFAYTRSFMPAELGWWGFLAAAPHQPATMPDEVEFYATRMLAMNTPVSLETHLAALKSNGRTEEMLKLLGDYERLRLSGVVASAVREHLRTGEWHRVDTGFVPIRYDVQRPVVPGEFCVTNIFAAQPLQFRLQAVPTLAAIGSTNNIALLRANPAVELPWPAARAPMPGALAGRIEFAKPAGDQVSVFMVGQNTQVAGGQEGKPLNLLHHRALAVKLQVMEAAPGAVLNLQLEAGGKTYRDHYVDLNFTGERVILLPEPTTERMLPEFRPAYANYAFKAAMYGFDYRHIVALNLRWMRVPNRAVAPCRVTSVEALAEGEEMITDPEISIGGATCRLPVKLRAGDYVECRTDQPWRVFDRQGTLLATLPAVSGVPPLQPGENHLRLHSTEPGAVKFTLITTGEPVRD